MVFCSSFLSDFRSYFSLIAALSVVLGATQSSLAQEQIEQGGVDDWVTDSMCAIGNRFVNLEQPPSFTFTQSDGNNPRHLDSAQAGLSNADLSNLELAWAVAFPDTSGLRAAPVIIGLSLIHI